MKNNIKILTVFLALSLHLHAGVGHPEVSTVVIQSQSDIAKEIENLKTALADNEWINGASIITKLKDRTLSELKVTTSSIQYSYDKGAEQTVSYEFKYADSKVVILTVAKEHDS